jgi:acyl-CoA synthetase (AMP-forming)/AMP-acid ligase II
MNARDFLASAARVYPGKIAYVDGSRRRTWAEIDERAGRLATALQRLGIGKGDTVAILAHDHVEMVEHWHACAKIGAVRVGINWRYAAPSMLHILRDSGAKALIVQDRCEPSLAGEFDGLLAEGRHLVGFGREHGRAIDYEELLAGSPATPDLPPLADDDVIAISYTSGTTGVPKGAEWTQRGVREALLQTFSFAGLRHEDVWFAAFPGAGVPVLQMIWNIVNGATVVLPDGDFQTKRFLELMTEHGVTATLFVPTMLLQVVEETRRTGVDPKTMRLICYGSMPATSALIRSAMEVFDCEFQQWYGATEGAGGWFTILRHADHLEGLENPELLSSCGRPLPHMELSVRDAEGRPVANGETGEIWVRSETIMRGYRNLPEQTAASISDGWFKTGDLGRRDERGYYYLLDRKSFLVISGGYNVYPVVVENALAQHPAVREVAAFGAPHPKWGEAVVCTVSIQPGASATADELIAFCRPRLAKWEVPKHVEIVVDLPKGATGKILKREVRERFRSRPSPWS